MGGAVSAGTDNIEITDNLVDGGYIKTHLIEDIFRAIDRGEFFPTDYRYNAYKDIAWRSPHGNLHISAPCIYSEVMEALELKEGLSFLNPGSGTGYLNVMVGAAIGVYGVNHGVELFEDVVEYCNNTIDRFYSCADGFDQFEFSSPSFVTGNCLQLFSGGRLYDRVYCGAACPPRHMNYMKNFLTLNGVLVMPVEDRLLKIKRTGETEYETSSVLAVSFASLIEPRGPPLTSTSDANYPPRQQQEQQSTTTDPALTTSIQPNVVLPDVEVVPLKVLCRHSIRSVIRSKLKSDLPDILKRERKRKKKRGRRARGESRDSHGTDLAPLSGVRCIETQMGMRMIVFSPRSDSEDDEEMDDLEREELEQQSRQVVAFDNNQPTTSVHGINAIDDSTVELRLPTANVAAGVDNPAPLDYSKICSTNQSTKNKENRLSNADENWYFDNTATSTKTVEETPEMSISFTESKLCSGDKTNSNKPLLKDGASNKPPCHRGGDSQAVAPESLVLPSAGPQNSSSVITSQNVPKNSLDSFTSLPSSATSTESTTTMLTRPPNDIQNMSSNVQKFETSPNDSVMSGVGNVDINDVVTSAAAVTTTSSPLLTVSNNSTTVTVTAEGRVCDVKGPNNNNRAHEIIDSIVATDSADHLLTGDEKKNDDEEDVICSNVPAELRGENMDNNDGAGDIVCSTGGDFSNEINRTKITEDLLHRPSSQTPDTDDGDATDDEDEDMDEEDETEASIFARIMAERIFNRIEAERDAATPDGSDEDATSPTPGSNTSLRGDDNDNPPLLPSTKSHHGVSGSSKRRNDSLAGETTEPLQHSSRPLTDKLGKRSVSPLPTSTRGSVPAARPHMSLSDEAFDIFQTVARMSSSSPTDEDRRSRPAPPLSSHQEEANPRRSQQQPQQQPTRSSHSSSSDGEGDDGPPERMRPEPSTLPSVDPMNRRFRFEFQTRVETLPLPDTMKSYLLFYRDRLTDPAL